MNKKTIIKIVAAVVVVVAVIIAVSFVVPSIQFEMEKKKAKENPSSVAYQVVTLAIYSSGLSLPEESKDDVQIYCDFNRGLEYTDWLDNEAEILEGSYLAEELTERNIVYAIIDGEYYTENGDNLSKVTAEKIYDATKVEREDGTYFYMASYGGELVDDKAILTEVLYVLEGSEKTLPSDYTLISIDGTVPTKAYSELEGKTLCSKGNQEGVILK